ncbi:nuclear factor 7, brain-like [Danio aesculapii]|uniref:nuclear factor 7, brain-like n=1 Tax=Danio aesculapii TaxID=1142201 RepID=UPI0024C060BF|nr:nuclear factor 7, brain-like [Danio aesculapii]
MCFPNPVILNPNTSAPELSVSDDLTSVTSGEANNVALHRSRLVLGSVGYGDAVYTWDINVGNSRYWSLGVCLKPAGRSVVQPLTPERGFWGLRRDGGSYKLMTTGTSRLNVKVNPDIVRVKLVYDYEFHLDPLELKCWRKVIFSDARSDLCIAEFNRVPLEEKIFPFLIAEDQSAPLCVVPSDVIVTVEKMKPCPLETYGVFFFICVGLVLFVVFLLVLLVWEPILSQVQQLHQSKSRW